MKCAIVQEAQLLTDDPEPRFSHSVIVYTTEESELLISRIYDPNVIFEAANLASLEKVRIPRENVYPLFEAGMTKVNDEALAECYVKRPSLLGYSSGDKDEIARLVLEECRFAELLRKHLHPNLVDYYGSVVQKGRIVGLCWRRYTVTLSEYAKSGITETQAEYILEGIQKGISHIHSLDYCHSDLNPNNIMLTEDHNPVVIDFDSCRKRGEPLGLKSGTVGWCLDDAEQSNLENDLYSFKLIKDFIVKKVEKGCDATDIVR